MDYIQVVYRITPCYYIYTYNDIYISSKGVKRAGYQSLLANEPIIICSVDGVFFICTVLHMRKQRRNVSYSSSVTCISRPWCLKDDACVHLGILSSPPSHVVVILSPRFAAISSTFLSAYPVKPRWSAIRWRFLHPEHRIMTTPFSYECLLKVLATVSLHTVHMNSMYLVGVNWRISDPILQVSSISEWLKSSSTRGKPEGIMWALAWEEQHLFWQPTIWGRSLLKEETLLAEATKGLCEDLEDKERDNKFWGPRNRDEEPVGT